MNAQTKIEHETTVNMTVKGQVLIPKALRERNGLIPGAAVRVGLNDRGETVVLPAETIEQKEARIRDALKNLVGRYPVGMGTDAYMRWLRGDLEP